jgi:hypothetical protein
MAPPAARKHALSRATAKVLWCPFCSAPREGDSFLKHCWDKHRALPLIITALTLTEAIKGAEVLRDAGFEVNFPALHDPRSKQVPQPRNRRVKA